MTRNHTTIERSKTMPDTRTLRQQIDEIHARPGLHRPGEDAREIALLAERWADEHTAAVSTVAFDEGLTSRVSGIEQGITRLAMISFAAGEESSVWNGTPGPNQWVRYRGHHVSRGSYPDGTRFSIQFRAHDGVEREATFEPSRKLTMTESALFLVADIDDLLDTVIEENGVLGEEVPDAEVVERIDRATAERVLSAWERFVPTTLASGLATHKARGYFLNAIDRGEVEP